MILKRTNKYIWITFVVLCLAASSKVFAQQWGPLIITNWEQASHFNDQCPLRSVGGINRCVVGCVATATAQIANDWRYPGSIRFSTDDAYTSRGNAGPIAIDGNAADRDFPTFSDLTSALSSIAYNQDQSEEAYFCFGTGIKLGMYYGSQSGAWTWKAASVFRDDCRGGVLGVC